MALKKSLSIFIDPQTHTLSAHTPTPEDGRTEMAAKVSCDNANFIQRLCHQNPLLQPGPKAGQQTERRDIGATGAEAIGFEGRRTSDEDGMQVREEIHEKLRQTPGEADAHKIANRGRNEDADHGQMGPRWRKMSRLGQEKGSLASKRETSPCSIYCQRSVFGTFDAAHNGERH